VGPDLPPPGPFGGGSVEKAKPPPTSLFPKLGVISRNPLRDAVVDPTAQRRVD